MKLAGIVTTTFECEDGFLIDITLDSGKNEYSAWIYHRDCGIKSLMFGTPAGISYESFLTMAEVNFDEYRESYTEEFLEE